MNEDDGMNLQKNGCFIGQTAIEQLGSLWKFHQRAIKRCEKPFFGFDEEVADSGDSVP